MTFTTYQITKGISSCSNSRAFGLDKLSIFHLKHLGSRGFLIPHSTLQRLRHILSDSIDLEVIHCHSNPETRRGLLSQHFLSAYIAPLSSSESYGGSLTSNRQQTPASIRSPTDERYRDIPPQRIVIKDCKINTAGGDLSMAVKLLKRQTISYKLQMCQVKGKDITHWRTAKL